MNPSDRRHAKKRRKAQKRKKWRKERRQTPWTPERRAFHEFCQAWPDLGRALYFLCHALRWFVVAGYDKNEHRVEIARQGLAIADAMGHSLPDVALHVWPSYGREHEESTTCWCHPERDRLDARILVHREAN